MRVLSGIILLLVLGMTHAAPPLGDTQGIVQAVRVNNLSTGGGHESFRVYFSSVDNDRWGCHQNDGYITVRVNGTAMSREIYDKLFSLALAASASGQTLALDSSGTDPCKNVNTGLILAR